MVIARSARLSLTRWTKLAKRALSRSKKRAASTRCSSWSRGCALTAAISRRTSDLIGKIVSDAMDKVGKEGVITVEEARGLDTVLELVEGMRFDRGYLSPYFRSDRQDCL